MKMKKKDIIINILCVLWIILVLILKFNGEYRIEQIEDFTQLHFLRREDLIIEYLIGKSSGTLNESELQMEGIIERQLAQLCILEDGSVYFLNTSQPMIGYLNDNLLPHVEPDSLSTIVYSAYYLGRLSTLDLLFLKVNRALISSDAKDIGLYPEEAEPQGRDVVCASRNGETELEKKHEQYTFWVYGIGENYDKTIKISRDTITGEYWSITLDINALILIPWLRTSWHYWEYIDLMYQELYPWLVEE